MIDLKRLAFDNGLNQSKLGELLGGLPQPEISKMMNGRRDIKQEYIDMLIAKFGKDTIETYMSSKVEPRSCIKYSTLDSIEDVKIIGEQSNIQHQDTRPLTAEECELCPAKLPYVKRELVQSREVNIREIVENKPHTLEHRSLRDMIGNPDYVQKVITEAMMPTFQPGDLLFIQFLPNNAKLISGAIYLIDTRMYGAMVRQVFVEQDYYILHSENPEYKELKLRKQDVYSFSLVLHSLRSDFKVSKATFDYAEVSKKREKQIEKLLLMHEQALAEIRVQNERIAEERKRQDEERKADRIRQDKLIERILQLGS